MNCHLTLQGGGPCGLWARPSSWTSSLWFSTPGIGGVAFSPSVLVREQMKNSFPVICSYHTKFIPKASASDAGKHGQLLPHLVPITATRPGVPLPFISLQWKGALVKTDSVHFSTATGQRTPSALHTCPHLALGTQRSLPR